MILEVFHVIGLLIVVVGAGEPPSEDAWWAKEERRDDNTTIWPFVINITDQVLNDLTERLQRTHTLSPPLEDIEFEYGFNSQTALKILKFWLSKYNWREREAYLNQYPQFKTQIQGLYIHYLHIKPEVVENKQLVPILLLHGWPGSVKEFYGVIPALQTLPEYTNIVFEIVVPSLPGFGFSDAPVRRGLGPAETAVIYKLLMERLKFQNYYIQGGDWGSQIASHMGLFYPTVVKGLHLNMCTSASTTTALTVGLGSLVPELVVNRRDRHKIYPITDKIHQGIYELGFFHLQATKPDTIGIALTDSPLGLATYIMEKFSSLTNPDFNKKEDGGLASKFNYTDLLDNVMIYWLSNSITTSMRFYVEQFSKSERDQNLEDAQVTVPTWCSQFEHEVGWLPTWILKQRYPNLVRTMPHPDGGHFAAMEFPDWFAQDVWNAVIEGEKLQSH